MPLKVKRHKKNRTIRPKNGKRLRRKLTKVPTIKSKMLEQMWNDRKSVKTNLSNMGLAFDPNIAIRGRLRTNESSSTSKEPQTSVAKLLEKQAKAPRAKDFKFPNSLALYFTYLIKKYGDDYKAMARDSKNVYQETWKQIRRRISQFKKLEQYQKFMGSSLIINNFK